MKQWCSVLDKCGITEVSLPCSFSANHIPPCKALGVTTQDWGDLITVQIQVSLLVIALLGFDKAQSTLDAEVNESVHTGCKQNQRNCS